MESFIYTRKRGSHERDKEALLDDFLVCGAGEEEEKEEGVDTVVERACQLQSLIPHWFLPALEVEAENRRRVRGKKSALLLSDFRSVRRCSRVSSSPSLRKAFPVPSVPR